MNEDFKLKFYFNIYKDKPLSSRAEFRIRFKKLHGEFKRLEELIKNIENYQIKKYGTTLYDWNTNNEREEAFYLAKAAEEKNKEREKKIMNEVFVDVRKESSMIREYFNTDLVTVEELIVAIEDLSGEIEHLEEIIEELKEYKEQYCELKKDSGY